MSDSRIVHLLQEMEPQKIAIIKPSALGDVVQALPLLGVLKKKFPSAKIDWVIRSELQDLLQDHPHLHQVIPYYRRGGWASWRILLGLLRRNRYDLVFDLQGLLRTGVMTAATFATLRIGLETSREYAHLACHGLLPDTSKTIPAHARYWKIAEYLGLAQESQALDLGVGAEQREAVNALLSSVKQPLLVIHPGAMWITKRWPVASFAEVAIRAIEQYGVAVAIVGAKGEQPDADFISQALHKVCPQATVLNLAGRTTLRQLACLLETADYVLTNDSGPMHLAAGLGTPVVGIFTCTSAERSGPAPGAHQLLQAQLPCAASYRKQCPFTGSAHMQCHHVVSIHQVWSGLKKLIEQTSQTKKERVA